MGQIVIGTSGYSYDDWKGSFYPADLPKERFLEHYSSEFPFVELNYSYYALPEAKQLEAMAGRTPESFSFSIKAHRSLTHDIMDDWQKNAALFIEAIRPLSEAGKLAGIVLQFPFSYHYTLPRRAHLAALADAFAAFPLFFEFRNLDWNKSQVREEMITRGIAWVCTDNPALNGLPLREAIVTAERAYIRFHGRNAAYWWQGDNTTRYDWLYSRKELMEWIPDIKEMQKKTKVIYIAFNNHYKGKSIQNGRDLLGLLAG